MKDFLQINIIGDSLFINKMKNRKLKNTFQFSIVDLCTKESTKTFYNTLLKKHFKEETLVITLEDLKYLKGLKLL